MANTKNIMIGLGALVLVAIAYLTFFNKPDTTPDLGFETAAGSSAELFFVNLAGTLDPIAFDTAIFSDQRFSALVDLSTAIVPETTGRPDPFAPLSGVSKK